MKRILFAILALVLLTTLTLSFGACDVISGIVEENNVNSNTPGTSDDTQHNHSYVIKSTSDKYLKSKATCTKRAVYYFSCECGEKGSATFESGTVSSHSWTSATCSSAKTCSACGATEGAKLNHSYSDGACTLCGAADPNYVPPHKHTYENCVCTGCGEEDPNYVPPHEHTYENGVCTGCGEEDPNYVPPHEHTYENGVCTGCGEEDPNYIDPTAPIAGTPYNLGIINPSVGEETYYICGGMAATYYLATSSDVSGAMEIYLENTAGGYYMYSLDGSEKLYINFVVNGSYVNAKYEISPATVYTYNRELKTVVAVVNGENYILGTRNDKTYTTVGPVKASTNPFYCLFYGVSGGSDTPTDPPHEHTYENGICTGCGESYYTNGLKYELNDGGGSYTITGPGSFNGANLVIPPLYEGLPVTAIGEGAFNGQTNIKSITIPESIISIADRAFARCTSLETIYYNSIEQASVPMYGNHWYNSGSSSGVKVTIGKEVTYLPKYLFYGLKMASVEFENGSQCEFIDSSAFLDCHDIELYIHDLEWWSRLAIADPAANPMYYSTAIYLNGELVTELAIPGGIGAIAPYAFIGCPVESIIIPEGVTHIGSKAFYGADSVKSLSLPGSLEMIENHAFNYCTSLQILTIPENVKSIGSNAFANCVALEKIFFNAKELSEADGEISTGFNCVGTASEGIELTIGKNVTRIPAHLFSSYLKDGPVNIISITFEKESKCEIIGNYAFDGCANLVELELPNSIIDVGLSAFRGCINLTTLILSENMISVQDSFTGCTSLTSVSIPDGVETLTSSFTGCTSLKNISLPATVTSITRAFEGCSALTSITIPKSVTYIHADTFKGCTSLADIYYTGTKEKFETMSYRHTLYNTGATIHYNASK